MPANNGMKLYRIGVTPECPVHQITVGGQTFPRRSEIVSGFGGETKRNEIQGAIVRMHPSQIKTIREKAATKVIRSTTGKKLRAKVHSTESRNYSPLEGDQPVAGFLYIEESKQDPTKVESYKTLAETGQRTNKR